MFVQTAFLDGSDWFKPQSQAPTLLFGASGMGLAGNVLMGTLARKAARRKRREQLNQPVFAKPMYGGSGNEDPVDTLQGDPDMFGDFDPISQMA